MKHTIVWNIAAVITILFVSVVAMVFVIFGASKAEASVCLESTDGQCQPYITPLADTPTPTPTLDIPSPTPTPNPCVDGEQFAVADSVVLCATPTPPVTETPVPTVTPTPGITPTVQQPGNPVGCTTNCGGSVTPSVCTGISAKPADLVGFHRDDATTVTFSWWPSTDSHDKQALVYGYDENHLTMGVDNLGGDVHSFTIHGLQANRMVWAQVWTFRGECKSESQKIDP